MTRFQIGSIIEGTYPWQVLGYKCQGDGIQAIGSGISEGDIGREHNDWVEGFNRSPEAVWEQIDRLPISDEAKRELGLSGVYPYNAWDAVLLSHDNWRKSRGKEPDSWAARIVRGPRPLGPEVMPSHLVCE